MSARQMELIRQRLEQELSSVRRAAGETAGKDREVLETLERVFRARLAELPQRVSVAPIRVEDVLPPAHQHVMQ